MPKKKIIIDKPYSFAVVKVIEPNLKDFSNNELVCGESKIKIIKPEWIILGWKRQLW